MWSNRTKEELIKFADAYSSKVWKKEMNMFDNHENYFIGCNDLSDYVLNAILNTWEFMYGKNPIHEVFKECKVEHEQDNML